MNLMLCFYFLIILVMSVDADYDDEHHELKKRSNDNFSRMIEQKLKITIKLDNIPTDVTDYILYHGTGTCENHSSFVAGRWHCALEVDLKKECEVNYNTGQVIDFYCESSVDQQNYVMNQWYQLNDNFSVFGVIMTTQSSESKFTIKTERFDNNTFVNCRSSSTRLKQKTKDCQTKITVIADENIDEYNNTTELRYSGLKSVKFDCHKKKANYVPVGILYTTAHNIKTIDRRVAKMKFNMADNGTILCCLFYTVIDEDDVKHITRHVTNKTVLIYDESLSHHNEEKLSANENTGSARSIYHIILSVLGVIVLVLVILIMYIKCWYKKPNPEVAMEMKPNPSSNMVLYAELDVQSGGTHRPNPPESTYSKVIGVLMPPDSIKKK